MSISRRQLFNIAAASFAGASASGWFPTLAARASERNRRRRSCILLWMTGGPSQTDTFDLKPDHPNGGPFKPIETAVPGIQISEHLPSLARQMKDMTLVRSMQTKEGDHSRATYLMRTGYLPQGPIHFPTIGSMLSKELSFGSAELPNFISISPYQFLSPAAYGPGFLGPQFAPLVVGSGTTPTFQSGGEVEATENLRVRNLDVPSGVTQKQLASRLGLLADFETDFAERHAGTSMRSHRMAYDKAVRMMRSESVNVFDLADEPEKVRDDYGRNQFGDGCLLARRLVEYGVPFIEVGLAQAQGLQSFGWDTHINNFDAVRTLSNILDPAWSTLISDLRDRGLLESTLIVWMGEFGRTPKINQNRGRDHFPAAWTTVMCGAGVKGGHVVGQTSQDGMEVIDRPVAVADLIATICKAVDVDPTNQNMSNVGRPIGLTETDAKPIDEILT